MMHLSIKRFSLQKWMTFFSGLGLWTYQRCQAKLWCSGGLFPTMVAMDCYGLLWSVFTCRWNKALGCRRSTAKQQSLGNWGIWGCRELIGFSHRRAMEEDHYTIVHDEVGCICCIMMRRQSSIDINRCQPISIHINPAPTTSYNSQSTPLSLKEGNLVHFDDHLTLGGIACALSHRLALQRHSNARGWQMGGYSTSEGMNFGQTLRIPA